VGLGFGSRGVGAGYGLGFVFEVRS
jgi:hypothetical protein